MAKKKEQEFSQTDSEEENLYEKQGVEEQLEDGQITSAEAGFMEGYDSVKSVECASCKGRLDFSKVVEREINGTTYWFCSKKCADHFEKREALD